jgi:AbrB family looped-hinge helix DNA binding protein
MTSKGRLTIPAILRHRYGIKAGTKICFIERDGEILFQPITKQYVRTICGMLKSKSSVTVGLLKERAKDKKREEAKLKKIVRMANSPA